MRLPAAKETWKSKTSELTVTVVKVVDGTVWWYNPTAWRTASETRMKEWLESMEFAAEPSPSST